MPLRESSSRDLAAWIFPRNEADGALPIPTRLAQRQAVAESSIQPRRWNAFVCPECRHVFRVPGNHDGRGVVCPSCRRMLRLPLKGESTPPLVLPKHEGPKKESSKARRDRHSAEIFDETFAKKERTDPTIIRIIIAGAMTLALALLAGIFWPRGEHSPGGESTENLLPPGLIELPEPPSKNIPTDTLSPDLVRRQLQPVVEAFMEAPTLKEASMPCRRSTRTLLRMQKFHGDDYYAPGFRDFVWNQSMTRDGNWAVLEIEDKEFRKRPMALVLEGSEWRIDWESWAGWSEIALNDLREIQPKEPVLVRVTVEPIEYYNFSFANESEWSAYRLADPDLVETLYGYVPSVGALDLQLKPDPGEKNLRYTLRVSFPEGAQSNNQVTIDEIVTRGWLVKEEDSP